MTARSRSKRRRSKKNNRASVVYTVAAAALLCLVVLLVLSLFDVFALPPTRAEDLTVLVLNGCGVEGVGQRVAMHLRDLGLDVVDFRNADSFDYQESMVVDRTGDMSGAVVVARMIEARGVIQQIPETPLVDVVVIVGADYERYLGS